MFRVKVSTVQTRSGHCRCLRLAVTVMCCCSMQDKLVILISLFLFPANPSLDCLPSAKIGSKFTLNKAKLRFQFHLHLTSMYDSKQGNIISPTLTYLQLLWFIENKLRITCKGNSWEQVMFEATQRWHFHSQHNCARTRRGVPALFVKPRDFIVFLSFCNKSNSLFKC